MHTAMLSTFALDEVGDRDAPIGSRKWALWVVSQARLRRNEIEQDVSLLQRLIKEIDQHRVWEVLGLQDFDVLCEQELRLPADQARAVMSARRGQSLGAVIDRAKRTGKAAPLGTNQHSKRGSDVVRPSGFGNNADYLTARIARDHPDIHEAMKRGEYASVRAAALDAGIIKPTATMPLHDMERLAAAIKRKITKDQLIELLEHLTEVD